jgi:hypothetical protein
VPVVLHSKTEIAVQKKAAFAFTAEQVRIRDDPTVKPDMS